MQTAVVIELIESALEDMHEDGRITEQVLRKKRSVPLIASAINVADIGIVSELGLHKEVAVFVPKGSTYIFLRVGKSYAYKNVISITQSEAVKANIQQIKLFLNNENWLDVSGVNGSELFVYSEYPPENYRQCERIEIVPYGVHHGSSARVAVVDTDAGALILSEPLAEDRFVVFSAKIMPALLDIDATTIDDVLKKYRIRTPDYAQSYFVQRVLAQLFIGMPSVYADIEKVSGLEEQRMYQRRPGSGPVAYVPQGSYNFNT